jgi:hypothetical protein
MSLSLCPNTESFGKQFQRPLTLCGELCSFAAYELDVDVSHLSLFHTRDGLEAPLALPREAHVKLNMRAVGQQFRKKEGRVVAAFDKFMAMAKDHSEDSNTSVQMVQAVVDGAAKCLRLTLLPAPPLSPESLRKKQLRSKNREQGQQEEEDADGAEVEVELDARCFLVEMQPKDGFAVSLTGEMLTLPHEAAEYVGSGEDGVESESEVRVNVAVVLDLRAGRMLCSRYSRQELVHHVHTMRKTMTQRKVTSGTCDGEDTPLVLRMVDRVVLEVCVTALPNENENMGATSENFVYLSDVDWLTAQAAVNAVQSKSSLAQTTADAALVVVAGTATFCSLCVLSEFKVKPFGACPGFEVRVRCAAD